MGVLIANHEDYVRETSPSMFENSIFDTRRISGEERPLRSKSFL